MKLFLVGLPGSGKSTISKELSRLLQYPVYDTDDIICEKEQCSIERIFEEKGETYFREYEKKVLHELLALPDAIISTGGGLPCFYDNMDTINKNGISIFLDPEPEAITERLWAHENQNRPLLKGKTKESLLQFLHTKLAERLPYYSRATFSLEGNTITGEAIVELLRNRDLL